MTARLDGARRMPFPPPPRPPPPLLPNLPAPPNLPPPLRILPPLMVRVPKPVAGPTWGPAANMECRDAMTSFFVMMISLFTHVFTIEHVISPAHAVAVCCVYDQASLCECQLLFNCGCVHICMQACQLST